MTPKKKRNLIGRSEKRAKRIPKRGGKKGRDPDNPFTWRDIQLKGGRNQWVGGEKKRPRGKQGTVSVEKSKTRRRGGRVSAEKRPKKRAPCKGEIATEKRTEQKERTKNRGEGGGNAWGGVFPAGKVKIKKGEESTKKGVEKKKRSPGQRIQKKKRGGRRKGGYTKKTSWKEWFQENVKFAAQRKRFRKPKEEGPREGILCKRGGIFGVNIRKTWDVTEMGIWLF